VSESIRIAILGAGNGGHATVARLMSLDISNIAWWGRSAACVAAIQARQELRASGDIVGSWTAPHISTILVDALVQADLVLVVLPAVAHEDLAEAIAKYCKVGAVVLLLPGRTGGAVITERACRATLREDLIIGETQTLPFTCRSDSPGDVFILASKRYNQIAFLGQPPDRIKSLLDSIFPHMEWVESTLVTSLNNFGAILHPAPVLLNLGRIESSKVPFSHYYEGITPSVARYLEHLDEERLGLGRALGVKLLSIPEWHEACYGSRGGDLYATIQQNLEYTALKAPNTINHRYIWEDVPTGLAPLLSLCRVADSKREAFESVLTLTRLITGVDYLSIGRCKDSFGVSSVPDIHRVFR